MIGQQYRDAALDRIGDEAVFANQNGLQRFTGKPLGRICPRGEGSGGAQGFEFRQKRGGGERQPLPSLGAAQQFEEVGCEGHQKGVYTRFRRIQNRIGRKETQKAQNNGARPP